MPRIKTIITHIFIFMKIVQVLLLVLYITLKFKILFKIKKITWSRRFKKYLKKAHLPKDLIAYLCQDYSHRIDEILKSIEIHRLIRKIR